MKKSLPFTPQQEEALNKFLKTTRLPKERERVKSLLALQRGKKRKDIAQILDINPATITEWKKQFLTKGLKGICLKPYPGNHYKLTRVQKEKIKWLITKHTPRELNCADKRFWTTKSLKILVKERFGIIYESPYTYRSKKIS